MRALVVARISRGVETGEASRIERDDEAAREWCEAQGHEVVGTAADRNVSGGKSPWKRPAFGPWLKDAEKVRSFDLIVANALDRLGRSVIDLVKLREWADEHGKRIFILSQNLSWPATSPVEGFVWTIMAALAEMELEMTKARYKAAADTVKENGGLHGKPCFGFMPSGDRYRKTLVLDPEQAPVIRKMIDQALGGATFTDIARWLDSEGVPTVHGKKHWSSRAVAQILRNPSLKGVRTDEADEKVLHRHEGLMTSREWRRLQTAIDGDKRARSADDTSSVMLDSDVIRCGLCGGPMYMSRSKMRTGEVRLYYRCRGPEHRPSRCRNGIPKELAEAWVDAFFISGDDHQSVFGGMEVLEQVETPGDDHSDEIADVEEELRSLDFDAPDFAEKQAHLLTKRARLRSLPVEPSTFEERPTGETIGERWSAMTPVGKREFLRSTNFKVTIRPAQDGEVTGEALGGKVGTFEGDPSRVQTMGAT